MKQMQPSFRQSQGGAVLVVSLLLLLVMTVLALASSQATRMQERMAGNARDHDLALQSAEAGLRAAERWVKALSTAPNPCSAGKCQVYELGIPDNDQSTAIIYRDNSWWNSKAWSYASTDLIKGSGSGLEVGMAKQDPQYFVEQFEEVPDALSVPPTGPPPARMHYRITSRGVGGTDTSAVVLQSTWSRRF